MRNRIYSKLSALLLKMLREFLNSKINSIESSVSLAEVFRCLNKMNITIGSCALKEIWSICSEASAEASQIAQNVCSKEITESFDSLMTELEEKLETIFSIAEAESIYNILGNEIMQRFLLNDSILKILSSKDVTIMRAIEKAWDSSKEIKAREDQLRVAINKHIRGSINDVIWDDENGIM